MIIKSKECIPQNTNRPILVNNLESNAVNVDPLQTEVHYGLTITKVHLQLRIFHRPAHQSPFWHGGKSTVLWNTSPHRSRGISASSLLSTGLLIENIVDWIVLWIIIYNIY